MTIAVTGCAGFIGINFLKFTFAEHPDDKVIGIDKLTYAANLSELEKLKNHEGFIFHKSDICNAEEIDRIFAAHRPDIVINFAAESHVDTSITSPDLFIKTNILGTQVLLAASYKYGVRRFHQVSTDEVYGDLPTDSTDTFKECSPLFPSSPYSASKASADLMTLAYRKTHGLSVSISRSSNNYGEYQHTEKFIPKAIKAALSDKPIEIYGDGSNVRNWIWVTDNCRAIDLIARHGKDGGIYNVGGETYMTNLTLAKLILVSLGKSEENIKFVADRKGHDKKYAIDSAKIKNELGWREEIYFDDGIKETVKAYKSHFNKQKMHWST